MSVGEVNASIQSAREVLEAERDWASGEEVVLQSNAAHGALERLEAWKETLPAIGGCVVIDTNAAALGAAAREADALLGSALEGSSRHDELLDIKAGLALMTKASDTIPGIHEQMRSKGDEIRAAVGALVARLEEYDVLTAGYAVQIDSGEGGRRMALSALEGLTIGQAAPNPAA